LRNSQKSKDYVFASAHVRSVEKNLLTREGLDKMIDSRTPGDALKILYDLGYGDGSEMVQDEKFGELLSQEIKKAYSFIQGIVPDQEDLNVFLYPYDYHNLKVCMKAEFLGIQPEEYLIDVGTINTSNLVVMVRERNFLGMTVRMKDALLEVVDVFSRTQDPQVIDFIFDKACYAEMVESAARSGNRYIQGYVSLLIDTINLKTFVRLRQMKKTWDVFSQVFLEGGRISEKLFISGYDEPYEQFAEKLTPFELNEVLSEGGAMIREQGRFTALERLCDNQIMKYAKSAKYVSFGIEPLAGYLIAKEGEIRTVRIVMTGLLQGLSREMIQERVRETYV
jgi:V/A-type H+-transporting ATPase subunit C